MSSEPLPLNDVIDVNVATEIQFENELGLAVIDVKKVIAWRMEHDPFFGTPTSSST
ncbi:MAG: hypothetical protein LKJ98_05465 [Olsenella sp.]|nr:hypothetical protein [Olsenella sp.]